MSWTMDQVGGLIYRFGAADMVSVVKGFLVWDDSEVAARFDVLMRDWNADKPYDLSTSLTVWAMAHALEIVVSEQREAKR